jgi:hypothetical protein
MKRKPGNPNQPHGPTGLFIRKADLDLYEWLDKHPGYTAADYHLRDFRRAQALKQPRGPLGPDKLWGHGFIRVPVSGTVARFDQYAFKQLRAVWLQASPAGHRAFCVELGRVLIN